tara:strand:- start:384 stop:623 length:240 start_codon:yes stop_codon:yes gene_type:complete
METLKNLFLDYEMIIINLSNESELINNLEKYETVKKIIENDEILTKMSDIKNSHNLCLKMLNKMFNFDENLVLDILEFL